MQTEKKDAFYAQTKAVTTAKSLLDNFLSEYDLNDVKESLNKVLIYWLCDSEDLSQPEKEHTVTEITALMNVLDEIKKGGKNYG